MRERERALVPILFLIYVCFPFLTTTFHCCCSPCPFFSVSIISYCAIYSLMFVSLSSFVCKMIQTSSISVYWDICIVCIIFFSVYCFYTLCVSSHSYNSFHDLCDIYLIFVVEMDGENVCLSVLIVCHFNNFVLSCSYHVS